MHDLICGRTEQTDTQSSGTAPSRLGWVSPTADTEGTSARGPGKGAPLSCTETLVSQHTESCARSESSIFNVWCVSEARRKAQGWTERGTDREGQAGRRETRGAEQGLGQLLREQAALLRKRTAMSWKWPRPSPGPSPAVSAMTHWSEWKPGHCSGSTHTPGASPLPDTDPEQGSEPVPSPTLTPASPRPGPAATQPQPGVIDQKQRISKTPENTDTDRGV